jgi:hypothetical protein
MATESAQHVAVYKSPPSAQRWFLKRSRQAWKKKCMDKQKDNKRLMNRVNDATRSREAWREKAEDLDRRVRALEAENNALREQLVAFKKGGRHADA